MSLGGLIHLADRAVIRVDGEDAEKLLGGLVTNDVARLGAEPAIYAGLLTPQGKIIADFIITKDGDAFLIDVASEKRAELLAKLKVYRLRSKATLEERDDLAVYADLEGAAHEGHSFKDPRLDGLGSRVIGSAGRPAPLDASAYHARRISLGVPEGGKDWDFGNAFPHEALFDQLAGVSFTKGCYVGQEIVSRMEHRGTARTRVVKVHGTAALSSARPDVKAGEVTIGRLGSVSGGDGLALVRVDRVAEFNTKGVAITADGVPLVVEVPAFARFAIA